MKIEAHGAAATLGLLVCLSALVTSGCGETRAEPDGEPLPASGIAFDVAWSTFIGGGEFDQMREVFVEDDGAILVVGLVMSSHLPTSEGAFQRDYAGDDPRSGHPGGVGGDAYVVRLDGDAKGMLAATYFGGSRQERGAYGADLAANGDVIIASASRSPDMPTTDGAYQQRYGGGTADACVGRLSKDLTSLRWCSYVGRGREDWPRGGLALGAKEQVYFMGRTNSPGFPVTKGFAKSLRGSDDHNAMLAGLSPDGRKLILGALIGGSAQDYLLGARVAPDGDILVAGHTRSKDFPTSRAAQPKFGGGKFDAWAGRFSSDCSNVKWCTFLGGSGDDYTEHRPLLLADGSFIICGSTASRDFPSTEGVHRPKFLGAKNDGFVTRYAADGSVVWSTLVGGSDDDNVLAPRVDAEGNVYVVGRTSSHDWPVTEDAIQPRFGGGVADGALLVLSPDAGKVVYGTYLGGSGDDIARGTAFAADGSLLIVGSTESRDFPTTKGVFQQKYGGRTDGFVMRLRRRK